MVAFRFVQRPEYLVPGDRILFREGRTKGLGIVKSVGYDPSKPLDPNAKRKEGTPGATGHEDRKAREEAIAALGVPLAKVNSKETAPKEKAGVVTGAPLTKTKSKEDGHQARVKTKETPTTTKSKEEARLNVKRTS